MVRVPLERNLILCGAALLHPVMFDVSKSLQESLFQLIQLLDRAIRDRSSLLLHVKKNSYNGENSTKCKYNTISAEAKFHMEHLYINPHNLCAAVTLIANVNKRTLRISKSTRVKFAAECLLNSYNTVDTNCLLFVLRICLLFMLLQSYPHIQTVV